MLRTSRGAPVGLVTPSQRQFVGMCVRPSSQALYAPKRSYMDLRTAGVPSASDHAVVSTGYALAQSSLWADQTQIAPVLSFYVGELAEAWIIEDHVTLHTSSSIQNRAVPCCRRQSRRSSRPGRASPGAQLLVNCVADVSTRYCVHAVTYRKCRREHQALLDLMAPQPFLQVSRYQPCLKAV